MLEGDFDMFFLHIFAVFESMIPWIPVRFPAVASVVVVCMRHVGGLGRLGDCRPATSGTPGEGIGIRAEPSDTKSTKCNGTIWTILSNLVQYFSNYRLQSYFTPGESWHVPRWLQAIWLQGHMFCLLWTLWPVGADLQDWNVLLFPFFRHLLSYGQQNSKFKPLATFSCGNALKPYR